MTTHFLVDWWARQDYSFLAKSKPNLATSPFRLDGVLRRTKPNGYPDLAAPALPASRNGSLTNEERARFNMAYRYIQTDYRAGEGQARRARDLIATAFGRDYDDLVAECNGIYTNLVTRMVERRNVTQDSAEDAAEEVLISMERIIRDADSGKNGPHVLPAVAVSLVLSALDLLREALPNGRTMQAYRNRHQSFIRLLGDYAEEAAGAPRRHDAFYADLGLTISKLVLEHGLVADAFGEPMLAPTSSTYEAIRNAAIEQVVYFIGCGIDGPIKVGIAADPKSRLANLQTAHHEKLNLLAITVGGREQEAVYHAHFAASRLNGEWFARSPEILAEIARLNQQEGV